MVAGSARWPSTKWKITHHGRFFPEAPGCPRHPLLPSTAGIVLPSTRCLRSGATSASGTKTKAGELRPEHADVGGRDPVHPEHLVIIEKDVDVDDAGTPAKARLPPQVGFELLEPGQQLGGRQLGFGPQHHVEESRLILITPCRRLVDMGAGNNPAHIRSEGIERRTQIGDAVAEVGAEGKVDGVHVYNFKRKRSRKHSGVS